MQTFRKIALCCAGIFVLTAAFSGVFGSTELCRAAALAVCVCIALGIGAIPRLKGYQYTAWIIAAVAAGMLFPGAFSQWGPIDLRSKGLVLVVVQLVMFGMGTQMRFGDFTGLAGTGKGVLIGLACHFSVMPLMGYLLTRVFSFDPEIAAGIILIGSCSSGLASNVMVYIARANLTLSVAVTAMATLAAPFFTPLLMKLLAGTYIHIKFADMMLEIVKIVLVPIGVALVYNHFRDKAPKESRWVRRADAVELVMPYISMGGIVYFTTVTTAAGRDSLLHVGGLLFLASVIHNAAGYFFGYWLSRLFGLDRNSARTVAFEVGLQNGGMASGLAGGMGKLGTVGLAAAVFSPWMNISGSLLANYWRNHPVAQESERSTVVA